MKVKLKNLNRVKEPSGTGNRVNGLHTVYMHGHDAPVADPGFWKSLNGPRVKMIMSIGLYDLRNFSDNFTIVCS